MITPENSLLLPHCPSLRCRRAKACRAGERAACRGAAVLRNTMPGRMMRLITALSLKAGGAKKARVTFAVLRNRPEGGKRNRAPRHHGAPPRRPRAAGTAVSDKQSETDRREAGH